MLNERCNDEAGAESRALTVVSSPFRGSDDRPLTDFLTQLIACDRQLPPYRRARKAEPIHAVSAYSDDHRVDGASHLDRRV